MQRYCLRCQKLHSRPTSVFCSQNCSKRYERKEDRLKGSIHLREKQQEAIFAGLYEDQLI